MKRHQDIAWRAVLDSSGTPTGSALLLTGATVTVRDTDGNLATIYSDDGVTATTNPLTVESDGEYGFYAANGNYDLTIAKTGFASETKRVSLFDPRYYNGIVGSARRDVMSKLTEIGYSVVEWGVTGDGTDETTKLESAVAAIPSGATLIIPFGMNVRINNEFTVNNPVKISAYGATLTQRAGTFTGACLMRVSGANSEVKGLTLVGTDRTLDGIISGADANGLKLVDVSGSGLEYGLSLVNISRVRVEGGEWAGNDRNHIRIQNNSGSPTVEQEIHVLGVRFDSTSENPATYSAVALLIRGLEAYRTKGVVVRDCKFYLPDNPTDSACEGCELRFCEGAVFAGNYALNGSMLVSVASSIGTSVVGNTGVGQNYWSIEVAGVSGSSTPCQSTTVVGNTIDGASRVVHGIGVQGAMGGYGLTIGNNSIKGVRETSIYVGAGWSKVAINGNPIEVTKVPTYTQRAIWVIDGGSSLTITGNPLTGDGTTDYAIQLTDCDGAAVSGNTIDGWVQGYLVRSDTATDNISIAGGSVTNCTTPFGKSGSGTFGSNITVRGVTGIARAGCTGMDILDVAADLIDAWGVATPEAALIAGPGSTFRNKSGGAGTTVYEKRSGTGNTGWSGL